MSTSDSQKIYYCDASALITAWDQRYRPTIAIFQKFWELLENIFEQERLIIPKIIFQEIKIKDSKISISGKQDKKLSLKDWLEDTAKITLKDHREYLEQLAELSKKYKKDEASDGKTSSVSKADLYLIAMAKVENWIVLTEEATQKQLPEKMSKYKIPAVCEKEKVECLSLIDFLEAENNKNAIKKPYANKNTIKKIVRNRSF